VVEICIVRASSIICIEPDRPELTSDTCSRTTWNTDATLATTHLFEFKVAWFNSRLKWIIHRVCDSISEKYRWGVCGLCSKICFTSSWGRWVYWWINRWSCSASIKAWISIKFSLSDTEVPPVTDYAPRADNIAVAVTDVIILVIWRLPLEFAIAASGVPDILIETAASNGIEISAFLLCIGIGLWSSICWAES